MKLGIVGLPNVGKSTLFNAITNAGAESASVDLPWAAPLAHDALSGQSFLAEGGRLHITLAPYDALLLTE